jgi:membrane protease YdiL (CAAX protease family)
VLLVAWGLQFFSVTALEKMGFPREEEQAVTLMLGARLPWLRVYLAVFAIFIAPVAEEFVFRGTLYPLVKQLGFPKLALFGVSCLFALVHANVPAFVPLFFFALAQTWLYERTDNLLAPITVHALFNAANLVALTVAGDFGHQLPVQP